MENQQTKNQQIKCKIFKNSNGVLSENLFAETPEAQKINLSNSNDFIIQKNLIGLRENSFQIDCGSYNNVNGVVRDYSLTPSEDLEMTYNSDNNELTVVSKTNENDKTYNVGTFKVYYGENTTQSEEIGLLFPLGISESKLNKEGVCEEYANYSFGSLSSIQEDSYFVCKNNLNPSEKTYLKDLFPQQFFSWDGQEPSGTYIYFVNQDASIEKLIKRYVGDDFTFPLSYLKITRSNSKQFNITYHEENYSEAQGFSARDYYVCYDTSEDLEIQIGFDEINNKTIITIDGVNNSVGDDSMSLCDILNNALYYKDGYSEIVYTNQIKLINQSSHQGVDIISETQDDVVAFCTGTVDSVGTDYICIVPKNSDDYKIKYYVNQPISIQSGKEIKKGTVIGKTKKDNSHSGTDNYFVCVEILYDGEYIDPLPFLEGIYEIGDSLYVEYIAPEVDSHERIPVQISDLQKNIEALISNYETGAIIEATVYASKGDKKTTVSESGKITSIIDSDRKIVHKYPDPNNNKKLLEYVKTQSHVAFLTYPNATSMKEKLFYNYPHLIFFNAPKLLKISEEGLRQCNGLKEVWVDTLTEIEKRGLWHDDFLVTFRAPKLKTIGEEAFQYGYSLILTNQNYDALETVCVRGLANCPILGNINFPAIKTIESYAFQSSVINQIKLGDSNSLTINSYAFKGSYIKNYFLTNSSSLSIGSNVFENASIKKLDISQNATPGTYCFKGANLKYNSNSGTFSSTNNLSIGELQNTKVKAVLLPNATEIPDYFLQGSNVQFIYAPQAMRYYANCFCTNNLNAKTGENVLFIDISETGANGPVTNESKKQVGSKHYETYAFEKLWGSGREIHILVKNKEAITGIRDTTAKGCFDDTLSSNKMYWYVKEGDGGQTLIGNKAGQKSTYNFNKFKSDLLSKTGLNYDSLTNPSTGIHIY